ncbi:hypothetical protein BJ165DRAFT_1433369 [Panaeolus papilionaceus]|nr:hypothetical protein BJ165DRAFT_1433369 [Panaeolus papilionaceus]
MWCTRWFLPLLLLPLPTASPFFLILFLFSLTLHAKPCFYCIVLLTTLFVSSCYWQPFALDSPLTVPWSENITTYSDALRTTLPQNYSQALPTVIRPVDRCWCDFSNGFFEPFNVTQWDIASVHRLKRQLDRQNIAAAERNTTNLSTSNITTTTAEPELPPKALFNRPYSILSTLYRLVYFTITESPPHPLDTTASQQSLQHDTPPTPSHSQVESPSSTLNTLPYLRTKYDLRPYGLGIVIDLSW